MTKAAAGPSPNLLGQVLSIPVDTVKVIIDTLREQQHEYPDAAVLQELHSVIDELPASEQVDLVALTWLGRDNCSATDWPAIRGETAEAYYAQTARYLLGMSMVGHFLEEGLSILGVSGEHARADQPSCQTGNTPRKASPATAIAPSPDFYKWNTRSHRQLPSAQT